MQYDGMVTREFPEDLTIPKNLQFSARAFANEASAYELIYKVHSVLSVLSKYIDISNLDGVTIAYDYEEALAELDRGYETSYQLTATKDVAQGVAMAPSVIRDGSIKTHLVLNACALRGIHEELWQETDCFGQSLHLIAHECAHVEATAAFDKAFPGVLLKKSYLNALESMRWDVILSAWNEYAACRIVGSIGSDPTNDYLDILLGVLRTTRAQCFNMIREYRLHANTEKVVA